MADDVSNRSPGSQGRVVFTLAPFEPTALGYSNDIDRPDCLRVATISLQEPSQRTEATSDTMCSSALDERIVRSRKTGSGSSHVRTT